MKKKIKNIGTITWHNNGNCGGSLQAYALIRTLEKQGYKAKIINYSKGNCAKKTLLLLLKSSIGKLLYRLGIRADKRLCFAFAQFERNLLNETKFICTDAALSKVSHDFDCIICGSDQIWAPNVFNPVYMANFANNNKTRKVSYAPSIGLDYIPEEYRNNYNEYLSDFYAISVREQKGKELLKDKCSIDAEVVLDPTMLLDVTEYIGIERPLKTVKQPFVFCYFLKNNNSYRTTVESYSKKKGHNIVGFSKSKDDSKWMINLKYIGPCEFLWLINKAEVVFTDSYHGTIFSLLYHKHFFTFERFNSEDPLCQNSRIYQLDKMFSIKDRILHDNDNIINDDDFNFRQFNIDLFKERNRSLKFLLDALS